MFKCHITLKSQRKFGASVIILTDNKNNIFNSLLQKMLQHLTIRSKQLFNDTISSRVFVVLPKKHFP